MTFDPMSLLMSMLVSTVGFGLFKYGRKQHRFPQTVMGVLMMVYPYVVTDVAWMVGLVPVCFGLLWLAVRFGL